MDKTIIEKLLQHHPKLECVTDKLIQACDLLENSFRSGGKLMLCGNGGSACDAEHIAGELMKSFVLERKVSEEQKAALAAAGDDGILAEKLQNALPCIVLNGLPGLSSAYNNDVDGSLVYAQQAWGYTVPGDVFIGITTSGSSKNVVKAAIAAKAKGAKIIGLTGAKQGKLAPLCDVVLDVPETETYLVQELHLPLYHALCLILEERFFGQDGAKV